MANEVNDYKPQGLSTGIVTSSIDVLIENMKMLDEVKSRVLKENVHYGMIPGAKKPFLFQAGAQALARVFNLSPLCVTNILLDDPDMKRTMKLPNGSVQDPATKRWVKQFKEEIVFGYYEVISTCTVKDQAGNIIAVANGTCNSCESKFANQSYYDAKNSVFKRAEKRAMVGALLMAVAGSGLFLDEDDGTNPQTNGSAAEEKPEWPNDNQRRMVFAKGGENSIKQEVTHWLWHWFVKAGRAKGNAYLDAIAGNKPDAPKIWKWAQDEYAKTLPVEAEAEAIEETQAQAESGGNA